MYSHEILRDPAMKSAVHSQYHDLLRMTNTASLCSLGSSDWNCNPLGANDAPQPQRGQRDFFPPQRSILRQKGYDAQLPGTILK